MNGRNRLVVLMLCLLTTVAGAGTLNSPAQAATAAARPATAPPPGWCYGDYCSGMDPHTTRHVPDGNYCDADGRTVASVQAAGTGLFVELRWSPNCGANWARVGESWGSYDPSALRVMKCTTGYTQAGVVDSNSDYSWTAMIFSPYDPARAMWIGQPANYPTPCR
jgi:hypothetical protein